MLLANKINDSKTIRGLTISTNSVKIGLYVDDTFLVLGGSGFLQNKVSECL